MVRPPVSAHHPTGDAKTQHAEEHEVAASAAAAAAQQQNHHQQQKEQQHEQSPAPGLQHADRPSQLAVLAANFDRFLWFFA